MDDDQTIAFAADGKHLTQLLWTTRSTSPNTTEDACLGGSPRKFCFGQHKNLALYENLSESAPDLGKKLESSHQAAAPQRLCKSADALLTKHYMQIRGYGRTTCKGIRSYPKCGKRYQPYAEIATDREGSCTNIPGDKSSTSVENKMLQIGNFNRRTNPLDYTLCLADYKTNWDAEEHRTDNKAVRLSIESLAKHLRGLLVGFTILRETDDGSIVGEFTNLEDMNRVIRLPLAQIFGTKVKSWRILGRYQYNNYQYSAQGTQLPQRHQRYHSPASPRRRLNNFNCHSYRRYLIAPDIPDTVPALEIQNALRFQGLRTGQVLRHMPGGFSIEVLRPCDYDRLSRDGVNFFNVAAFPVYPSSENLCGKYTVVRDGKCVDSTINTFEAKSNFPIGPEVVPEIPVAILQQTQHRENIQCFKCQRYGHKATHCKYWTRCVRCGGKHKVSDCGVPMTAASCCLCKGAHHAASRECPVHTVHANAVQVTFVMARTDLKSSSFNDGRNIW